MKAASGGRLDDAGGRDGECGTEGASGDEDCVSGGGDGGCCGAVAARVGDEDRVEAGVEFCDERVCGGVGGGGEGCVGGSRDGSGGGGAGDVDVAGGIESHGKADVAFGS